MADLVVVGSVALDTVTTPFGQVTEALGGSATYFSYAASFFTRVGIVAAVGQDFPREHLDLLGQRGVDIDALTVLPDQKTFRWTGEYGFDLNEARTIDTQLNAFAVFKPDLPATYRHAPFLFLANIDPDLQREVRRQMTKPLLTALDTMNFWIDGKRDALLAALREVDVLLINDAEARMLAREPNLIKAARSIIRMGPGVVVIKRGEYGSLMVSDGEFFFTPAYPLENVFDPTGAGDTFAGGFMGYLAQRGLTDRASVRKAVVFGAVMASFAVEDFSLDRLKRLEVSEIEQRYAGFQSMVAVED
ncbi:MAG TPA: PfkB family carbohydrate kinase [Candidatus Methylomirabilis sp.]|nr:PfkB family carbohydrate kinase [Candidatus Methylomirabilis sp.]